MYHRPGRTRVKVLVVLLTVALTAALGAVGIQRVRQEAAAVQCRNNLKQLGLAVHNYQNCMNRLPHLIDQGEGCPTGTGLPSVFHNLMPFIEARPVIYAAGRHPPANYHGHSTAGFTYWNKDGTTGTHHGGAANECWKLFLDPTDATAESLRDVPMTLPDGSTGYYATGIYAANGLMPWGVRKPPESFLKGSGNTILFAERPQVCRTAAGEDIHNLWGVGFYSPHMPAFAALTPPDPPGLWSTGQVAPVDRERVRIGRQEAPAALPDHATPVQLVRPGRPCDPRLPGTPHRSGMQAVMGDGSVRVYGLDTDPWVFWTACVP
jgi:hypothetical protein